MNSKARVFKNKTTSCCWRLNRSSYTCEYLPGQWTLLCLTQSRLIIFRRYVGMSLDNFWMPTETPNHIFVLLFSAEYKVNSLIQLPKNRQKFVHCFFLIHKRQKIFIMRMLFKMCGKGGVFPFLQSTVLYVGLVQRLITYLGIWRLTRNLLQLKVGTIEYLGIWNRFI